jgi:hypothetical protein
VVVKKHQKIPEEMCPVRWRTLNEKTAGGHIHDSVVLMEDIKLISQFIQEGKGNGYRQN